MASLTSTELSSIGAEPLALVAREAASVLGVSYSQFWNLHTHGRLPSPVRLGAKKPVWVLEELRNWLASGAPPRDVWESMKQKRAS
jgi:predicted DNA-binding transcriptional regulator AlpA